MHIDSADYLRLDVVHALGASATGASFATSSGDVLDAQCHGEGAFRLLVGTSTRPDYGLVVSRPKGCTTSQPAPQTWAIACGDTRLEIRAAPLDIRLLFKDRVVLRSATDRLPDGSLRLPAIGRLRQGGLWSAAFALESGEPVYGLGEKFGALDKRGQLVHSQVHAPQDVNTGRSGANVPFAWSAGTGHGAWGVFVHTTGAVTHAPGHAEWSHRSYGVMVDDEALDLFVYAGANGASIVDLFTQTTGRPAIVPRWSLGLVVARPASEPFAQTLAAASRLRERKLPVDTLVVTVPDNHSSLTKLAAQSFHVCVRESAEVPVDSPRFQELASHEFLLATDEGEPYVCAATDGVRGDAQNDEWREFALVDFTHPDAFAWWRDSLAAVFEQGADAIAASGSASVPGDASAWNGDATARLHNVYPLLHARCIQEATARYRAPRAGVPVALSDAGWTGSQRYPVIAGPDGQRDWEGLAATLRGALSSGMSGFALCAASIGGGYGESQSAELFVRWLQAAIFFSHVQLPASAAREPWTFGAEAEGVLRKWLALRYRLIPYFERAIANAAATGMPLARAMPLAFPESRLVRDFETQFMCGDALLVAPILRDGGEGDIALPPGAWYDLNTRARYTGSQVLRYAAKLDQFPVFGREGFALPLGRAVQHTGEMHDELPVEALWVFGRPAHPLEGFRQVKIEADRAAGHVVRAMLNVDVQVFGDAPGISVLPL
jgi:alpha-D-xyloside xylohydrolase